MKARIPIPASQKQALNREIDRQLAEHMREHEANYKAAAMMAARRTFKAGRKKLMEYYTALNEVFSALEAHYEMPNGGMYISKVQLKQECGIDVDELQNKNKIFDYEVK